MKLSRLVMREIAHRKGNFLLSLVGVAVATIFVVTTFALLAAHKKKTTEILADMQASTAAEMTKLEDEIRKSMKGLGFNIFIFPKDQDLSEVYAEGYASKTMPEEFVMKLANSKIVTVNHLLPSLTQKLTWEERQRTVILIGIRGQVPIAHRDPKKPLMEPVDPGTMVMGYELHNSLGLKEGDEVDFQGKKLKIAKTHKPRGSTDDITIWMNLGEAQQLLGKDGQINAIQALECNCASIDRLGEIRAELLQILPDTQIIETESTALARAEARNLAKATAQKAIADVEREQQNLQAARESFAGITLPVVALAAMVWIGLLTLTNVRDRVTEIGILRAVGVKGGSIFSTFILRAALAGIVGAILGIAIFAAAYPAAAGRIFHGQGLTSVVAPEVWIAALIATPILAAASAWLPAMLAAQKDPAEVLRQD